LALDIWYMKLLFTGASGMVGGYVADHCAPLYDVLVASHAECDVTNRENVMAYMLTHMPDVVVHAAGIADPKKAEAERGDEGGQCFRTNVLGTRNMKEAADRAGAFFIHISTGSVFFGSDKHPGPFDEYAPLSKELGGMSWYGWTKALAEKEAGKKSAIVRLSKPLVDIFARKCLAKLKRDYLAKLLYEYKHHTLAGLMTDQFFPVVSLSEVAQLLCWIIEHKSPGVYHAASPDMTTPYTLVRYALGGRGKALRSTRQKFDEFTAVQDLPLRHQRYSAIDSRQTTEKTGIKFRGWKYVVRSL
jgi:dTDP-4-dehydrorhamnose reductase